MSRKLHKCTVYVHLYGVIMAIIQKFTRLKGIVYRVLIRKADTKPISKTFTSKKLAIQFAKSIDVYRAY